MDAPHVAHGKAICCPACGGIFTPVLPRAQVVDFAQGAQEVASSGDVAVLAPLDQAANAPAPQVPAVQPPVQAATPYVPAPPPVLQIPVPTGPQFPGQPPSPVAAAAIGDALGLGQQGGQNGAADALAMLAAGGPVEPAAADLLSRPPDDRPDGWYIETGNGDVGPFTSREIAVKAYHNEIGRETVLFHPGKGVRLVAGKVPSLSRRGPAVGAGVDAGRTAPGRPGAAGGDTDPEAPEWFVEIAGKEIGPLSTVQVEQAAQRGLITRDAVLTFPRKGIRVVAGDVPRLFPPDRPPEAAAQPPEAAAQPADAAKTPQAPSLAPQPAPDEPPNDPLSALQQALAAEEAKRADADPTQR